MSNHYGRYGAPSTPTRRQHAASFAVGDAVRLADGTRATIIDVLGAMSYAVHGSNAATYFMVMIDDDGARSVWSDAMSHDDETTR